jgi:hypothetical protein
MFAIAPEPDQQAPALAATEEPERLEHERAAPVSPERRDLEPTDK